MPRRTRAGGLVAMSAVAWAASASAQPGEGVVDVGGERWTHRADVESGVETFARGDGTTIDVAPTALPCDQQLRLAQVERPAWVAPAYDPIVDDHAGFLVLCLARPDGPMTVTVKPGGGARIGPHLGPILAEIAARLGPTQFDVDGGGDVGVIGGGVSGPPPPPPPPRLDGPIDPDATIDDAVVPDRPAGWHPRLAHGAVYVGLVSLAPRMGERQTGGLVGVNARAAGGGLVGPLGRAFSFEVAVGYGAGELIGEARTGAGLSLGGPVVVDVLVGAGVGSFGPIASIDLHGEAGLAIPTRRATLWLGARHAIPIAGDGHSQAEVRLHVPRRGDTTWFLGGRYVAFAGDEGLFVTLGAGFAARK